MMRQELKTVYVGMSGGVDSSVAAALLKKQGFEVVGVFMRPWQPETRIKNRELRIKKETEDTEWCLWKQDREDALRAAAMIGIRFETWDFSKEYKKSVTDYMIREYRAGRTPNPDVMCNKEIKFGLFLKRALKEGADFIATGHYVRLQKVYSRQFTVDRKRDQKLKTVNYKLLTGRDGAKDQSYFLWTLTQEQLKYCLFPIGDYVKPEVRKLAKKFKLPNHAKKDSQGVCFIGPLDMKEFLTEYIKPKPGKILHTDGSAFAPSFAKATAGKKVTARQVGTHDGVYYYTIGQRHGLDIKDGGGPYYVVRKDIKKNIIYVGENIETGVPKARVVELSWVNKPVLPATLDVKVRYRAKSVKARLLPDGTLTFLKPERAVTPGQSAVFYKGKQLLGGGIIV